MTPEGKVIDCGLGPSLLTPALFACGLCPDLFRPGAMLVADPGVAAVVGVGFTMCTVGVTVGYILDTLPRHPSSKPAIAPQHPSHTPTSTFDQGFLFLPYGQHRARLFNRGRIVPLYREAHRRMRDRRRRACMNEKVECTGRGADKRAVGRRQDGRVESDTTNCHSSPFGQRIRGGPRERRWKCCDIGC